MFSSLSFLLCFFLLQRCYGQDSNLESKCFKQNKEANDLSLLGQFVPSCEPDGKYSKKQCHENYCFCVNQETGEEFKNAIKSDKDINCEDSNLQIYGEVILPSIHIIQNESCLRIIVREDILCEVEECDIPVVAQLEVKNPLVNSNGTIFYEMVLKNPKMTPHIIEAVLNNGWCKSKLEQVWIKYGDFKNDVAHNISPLPNQSVLKFDVKLVEYVDSETECPDDVPIVSCGFNPCKRLSCIDYPTAVCKPYFCGVCKAEFFVGGTKVDCKSTSCSDICPLLYDPKCASNGLQYPNLCSLEYAQCKDNTITMASNGPCQTDLKIYGKVILPNPVIPNGSCISITIKENILCEEEECNIPIIDKIEVLNPEVYEGGVLYMFTLKNPKKTPHVIEAVFNNGWCKRKDENVWIKNGDFKNDVAYVISPKPNQSDLKLDIKLKKYVPSKTACERLAAKKILPGSFVPKCTADGLFEKQQCHSSTGSCWCAHPKTGIAIKGTSTIRGQVATECNNALAFSPACIKPCNKDYNPVCGNDDQTYSNMCELQNAQCHDLTIRYAYSGKCAECSGPIPACSFKPCAQIYCHDYPEAVCKHNFCGGCNAEFYNNGVMVECKNTTCMESCTLDYNPKCASNGVEYSNQCLLEIAQCKDHSIILEIDGPCQSDDNSDNNSDDSKESSSCQKTCPEDVVPVCGTDYHTYHTYSNLCMLKNAQCQNKTIKYVHNGSCTDCPHGSPTPACGFKPCDKLRCLDYPDAVCKPNYCGDCKADFYLDGKKIQCSNAKCNKDCPLGEYSPMCGSNGVQYISLCSIEVAQCENNSLLIEHKGLCSKECPDDAPTPTCGFKPCDKLSCLDYPDAECKPDYCGDCTANFYLGGKKIQCNNTKCNKVCPSDEYSPMCGSNGVQYISLCSIEVAQCEDNSLTIQNDGPCEAECPDDAPTPACGFKPCDKLSCLDYPDAVCKPNYCGDCKADFYLDGKKIQCNNTKCNKECPDDDNRPMCGSNGVQYKSLCSIEVAQCEDNSLVIEFDGPCQNDTTEVTCVRPCSDEHKPVCGSDGQTYSNLCEFSNAQCKNKDLSIKHHFTCRDDINVLKTIEVSGLVKFPQDFSLNSNSCLSMTLQEGLYCKEIPCKIPVLASYHADNLDVDAIRSSRTIHYKMSFNYSTLTSYVVGAIVNNGWCKDKDNSIKYGDYHNEYSHTITPLPNQEKIDFDVTIVEYKDPSVVEVSGLIIFPKDVMELKSGSCLSVTLQEELYCKDIPCNIPVLASYHSSNLNLDISHSLHYKMSFSKLASPSYVVKAIVNNGWCKDKDSLIKYGDYHNDFIHNIHLSADQQKIDFNITVNEYKDPLPTAECPEKSTECKENKCQDSTCPGFPLATCVFNKCSCAVEFYVNDSKVNCISEYVPPREFDNSLIYNETSEKSCVFKCADIYDPVCGSDRRTHSSQCTMLFSACSTNSKIFKIHNGACGQCKTFCTREIMPQCGSDGITYINNCEMEKKICESNGQVKNVYSGSCDKPNCPEACTAEKSPQCGSDKKTYDNMCMLQISSCMSGGKIKFLHEGQCQKCVQSCTKEWDPYCGSDGETYGNLCLMNHAICESAGNLQIKYAGDCRSPVCPKSCSQGGVKVCGTDNNTYVNLCELQKITCKNKNVYLNYIGECRGKCLSSMCQMEEVSSICGSDGKTYSRCLFRRAQCLAGGEIRIAYKENCRKTCSGQKMPARCKNTCSSLYCPAHPSVTCIVDRCNSCQAKFMLLSNDVTNECGSVCNEVCNSVFDPICANNGLTYDNECFLNVARCKSKGKVKLAYRGECKLNYL